MARYLPLDKETQQKMRERDKKRARDKSGKSKWSWFGGGLNFTTSRRGKPFTGNLERHVCLNWTHVLLAFFILQILGFSFMSYAVYKYYNLQ